MSRGPAPWKSSDVAWRGGKRPYDLIKELIISGTVVAVIVVGLAVLFASPDPPPATFKEWAGDSPIDFVTTTLSEVDGTSLSATYGPPYQPASEQNGSLQGFGPLSPERWFGAAIPIDTFEDYVARPLGTLPDPGGQIAGALDEWRTASDADQTAWSKAYGDALQQARFSGGAYDVPAGDYGPLGTIIEAQYAYALSGGLDSAIVANRTDANIWYSNDQTFALLYFGDSGQGGAGPDCISPGQAVPDDGCWWYNQAVGNTAPRYGGYLEGGTWGVINEVANWPGAWWLFPYSFWYQWGYGADGQSGDLYAMLATGAVTMLFIFLPWIPGLRNIPHWTRFYKVMWGDYYRMVEREQHTAGRQ